MKKFVKPPQEHDNQRLMSLQVVIVVTGSHIAESEDANKGWQNLFK
jgi:hypothetical protein